MSMPVQPQPQFFPLMNVILGTPFAAAVYTQRPPGAPDDVVILHVEHASGSGVFSMSKQDAIDLGHELLEAAGEEQRNPAKDLVIAQAIPKL